MREEISYGNYINRDGMIDRETKIYFDSIGGQTVYNTFVTQEKIFKNKQRIEYLDVGIYLSLIHI